MRLGHSGVPRIFPVFDRTAIDGRWKSYEAYFEADVNKWRATSEEDQQALIGAQAISGGWDFQ